MNVSIETRQSILGNFLFAYCMRVYVLRNLHCHSMVATLFGKNMLCCYANLFDPQYHSLSASKYGDTKKIQSKGRREATAYDLDGSTLDVDNPTLNKAIELVLNEDGSGYGGANRITSHMKVILASFDKTYLSESGRILHDILFQIAKNKNDSKQKASLEGWKNVDSGEEKEKSESEDESDNGSDNGSDEESEDQFGIMGALKKRKNNN